MACYNEIVMEEKNKKLLFVLLAELLASIVAAVILLVMILNGALKNPVVGVYSIYSYFDSDGKESRDFIDFYKSLGGDQTIEFFNDGTGEWATLTFDYSTGALMKKEVAFRFTWKDGAMKLSGESITREEDSKGTYELSEDKQFITVTASGSKSKFKRK